MLRSLLVDEGEKRVKNLLCIVTTLGKHRAFRHIKVTSSRSEGARKHSGAADDFLVIPKKDAEMPPAAISEKVCPPGRLHEADIGPIGTQMSIPGVTFLDGGRRSHVIRPADSFGFG